MATRNYKFGCRAPCGKDYRRIMRELELAHRYRATLVEIELRRRKQLEEAAKQASPEWATAKAECDRIDEGVAFLLRESDRGGDRLAPLRQRQSEWRSTEKKLRKAAYAAIAKQAKRINEESYAAIRDARASCGLYWGNYLLVEQAAESFRSGSPPRHRPFTGEGCVGVQIQGGADWQWIASGQDTRLRIVPDTDDPRTYAKNGRELPAPSAKRAAKYRELSLRVGTIGGSVEWVRLPVILDRELPTGARIKWATINRRLVGERERWSLVLTCDVPEAAVRPQDLATSGACGLDIGYRIMPDGRQRVATWVGDDWQAGQLTLPAGMRGEWQRCRDMRSIRDEAFNATRDTLVEWLRGREGLPGWFATDAATLHQWRSSRRLSRLVERWSRWEPSIDGDAEIVAQLVEWRGREEHLHQYESHLRDQVLASRKDYYRKFAAELRRKYKTVVIEKMDLRVAIHDVRANVEDREVFSAQRAAASFVCLSELRQSLINCGMEVVEVDPADTTVTCFGCQRRTEINAAQQVEYKCEHCGREWDQDTNAAINILARGMVRSKSPGLLATEEPQGDTSGNGKGKRKSRSERNAAARDKRSKAAREKVKR